MRGPILSVLPVFACLAGPALALDASPDREALRKAWHRCVRQEFSGQPARLEKQAAERAALTACKPQEDAYVAAELADLPMQDGADGKAGAGERAGARARAWLALVGSSVAAYVVDPIASWFHGSAR